MHDHSKLRGRIVEKFGTISEFTKALGSSTVTVSAKLNNKSGFSRGDIEHWSELLEIPFVEIGLYFFTKI